MHEELQASKRMTEVFLFSNPRRFGSGHWVRMSALAQQRRGCEKRLVEIGEWAQLRAILERDDVCRTWIDAWHIPRKLLTTHRKRLGQVVVFDERRRRAVCDLLGYDSVVVMAQPTRYKHKTAMARHLKCRHQTRLGMEFWVNTVEPGNHLARKILFAPRQNRRRLRIGIVLGSSIAPMGPIIRAVLRAVQDGVSDRLSEIHAHSLITGEQAKLLLEEWPHASSVLQVTSDRGSLAETLEKSDILITGGGYSKLDAIQYGSKPIGVIALRPHQIELGKAFESAGLGIFLGNALVGRYQAMKRISEFVKFASLNVGSEEQM